ncbi:MAG TPA: methionine--tRNA ligase subunit beta [Thermoproteota archaeon]|nr:methionine--tRNA ligase subunit beta [Thermoproteota archaeon]
MDTVNIEDYQKLDIRVAKVLKAEQLKGSNKLIQLTLDMGQGQRTVVAGIAQTHKAEQLVGKNLIILANLAPRKLMGVTSEGMVLAAEQEGDVYLLTADGNPPAGARVI